MAGKSYKAPPRLDICNYLFEDWIKDINIWAKLPEDSDSKGSLLYLSLEGRAKDIVRCSLSPDEIVHCTEGVKNIVDCLSTFYRSNNSYTNYRTFLSFIYLKRQPNQSVKPQRLLY